MLKKLLALSLYFGHFLFVFACMGGYYYYWDLYQKVPEQPIPFSHNIHVHKLGLDCTYCHTSVTTSTRASVPQAELCMGCHASVKTDSPHIIKLTKYFTDGEPIPWKQVHAVKNHVGFTHKRHIAAGLDCSECHGQVAMMGVARQVSSLKMGWCVSCHYDKKAPVDCWTCHK